MGPHRIREIKAAPPLQVKQRHKAPPPGRHPAGGGRKRRPAAEVPPRHGRRPGTAEKPAARFPAPPCPRSRPSRRPPARPTGRMPPPPPVRRCGKGCRGDFRGDARSTGSRARSSSRRYPPCPRLPPPVIRIRLPGPQLAAVIPAIPRTARNTAPAARRPVAPPVIPLPGRRQPQGRQDAVMGLGGTRHRCGL